MKRWIAIVGCGVLLLAWGMCGRRKTVPAYTKDFCSSIHFGDSGSLERELAPLADSMPHKTGVCVLEDGGNAIMARAWLSEHAEKTIDVQYFIFSADNVGLIACDYLVRAADRGVKVRILVDDLMVDAGVHEILTMDSHENISVRIYNPGVNLGKNLPGKLYKFATDFRDANQRMHNKTFTVDGRVAITGGRNISDEYFDYSHRYNYRDRDVLLLGKAVQNVGSSFEEFWNSPLSVPVTKIIEEADGDFKSPDRFARLHQYACNPDNFWPQVREKIKELPQLFDKIQRDGLLVWTDSVTFVSDTPGKNTVGGLHGGGVTTSTLAELVRSARKTIDIQSPYLIMNEEGRAMFRDAVARGVRVRILTNSFASTDNLAAFAGYQKVRKEVLATGVKIYEFRPDANERRNIMTSALQQQLDYAPTFGLHAKGMVIDSGTVVIGTFNLDPRSANLNTECITIIRSNDVAQSVLRGMDEEFKPENSWETTVNFNPDDVAGVWKRTKTWPQRAIPKKIL